MLPNLVTLFRIAAALPCKVSDLVSVFDKEDLSKLLPK
jgi:DNA-binding Xre family transcriptional regulator